MRLVPLAWAGVLALVLVLPAPAQDKKKDKGAVLTAAQVLQPGQYAGKLESVSGSTFVLGVNAPRLEPKPGAQRKSQNINNHYQAMLRDQDRLAAAYDRLSRARTPQQQRGASNEIGNITRAMQGHANALAAAGGQSLFNVKYDHRRFEVEMATNVEVRTMFLPPAYDDMGNLKEYTEKEKRELKGPNPSAPGYKSDLSALTAGQKVRVTLAKVREKSENAAEPVKKDPEKKDPEKKDPEKKDVEKKDPDKAPEKDAPKPPEARLQATRILILEESNEPVKPDKGKKKDK